MSAELVNLQESKILQNRIQLRDLLCVSRGRCGDEELISLKVYGDHILLVDGVEESRTQTEIRGDEGKIS